MPTSTLSHITPVTIQQMFNRIAKTYDVLNDCISFGMHRLWKRRACQQLQLKPGDHVLDVCTGTGDLIGYLLPLVGKTGAVTGLDFSEEMLNVARERFPENTSNNIHLQQGDALALPFEDNTFDGAMISFGLRNVTDIPGAIREMTRVVKPSGWVVNLDTCPQPKLPGYWLYFKHIMPRIGKLICQDKGAESAYSYLSASTQNFLSPDELKTVFESAGLHPVSSQTLMFQSVSLQAGQKPD